MAKDLFVQLYFEPKFENGNGIQVILYMDYSDQYKQLYIQKKLYSIVTIEIVNFVGKSNICISFCFRYCRMWIRSWNIPICTDNVSIDLKLWLERSHGYNWRFNS